MRHPNPTGLIDPAGTEVADLDVRLVDGHYQGTCTFLPASEEIRRLFAEFEEIVENQVFSLLDDIEGRIDRLGLRARFDSGESAVVTDLQAYPSTNAVSFKAAAAQDGVNGVAGHVAGAARLGPTS